MVTTQTQLKAVSDDEQDDETPETPDIDRSDVVRVIPLPGIEQVDMFAEWCELADVVRDDVVAAINGDQ